MFGYEFLVFVVIDVLTNSVLVEKGGSKQGFVMKESFSFAHVVMVDDCLQTIERKFKELHLRVANELRVMKEEDFMNAHHLYRSYMAQNLNEFRAVDVITLYHTFLYGVFVMQEPLIPEKLSKHLLKEVGSW